MRRRTTLHHSRRETMKILVIVVGLVGVIACGNTFGGELNLICTGEEYCPRLWLKSPYSFQDMIDLDSKAFTIRLKKTLITTNLLNLNKEVIPPQESQILLNMLS